jgi:hypothetical protein
LTGSAAAGVLPLALESLESLPHPASDVARAAANNARAMARRGENARGSDIAARSVADNITDSVDPQASVNTTKDFLPHDF